LDQLRRRIDRIDEKLLGLLKERAQTALRIGRIKKSQGLPVYDGRREQAVLRRLTRKNGGPLPASSVKAIFREILRRNRGLQGR
jgi:chorismate mutase-like protein